MGIGMRVGRAVVASLMIASSALANAQASQGRFDPRAFKGPRTGEPNEVMVLGTPHLSALPKTFNPAALAPVLARLRSWRPAMIAIEDLSGMQCDHLRRFPQRYRDTIDSYCPDLTAARAATGLDVPAATEAFERLLATWPTNPGAAQRRRLAATFLAAGERGSALVQWLRLPQADRIAGDRLDAALVAQLEQQRSRRSETTLIAARLAADLGHERLYAMDDHTADSAIDDEKAYAAAIAKAWDNPATAHRRAIDADLEKSIDTGDGVLAMYRRHNAADMGRLAYDSDFGAALEEPSPQKFGRSYLGYWETRNLRMASNIREMLGGRPGSRSLVIVGASHKAYLDAYLDEMHDVRIVSTDTILR